MKANAIIFIFLVAASFADEENHFNIPNNNKGPIAQNSNSTLPSKHLDISGLDIPSLLNIFDHLDLDGLINTADTNEHFRQLITVHHMLPVFHIDERVIRIDKVPMFNLWADKNIHSEPTEAIHNYNTTLLFYTIRTPRNN